ncbi:hypothetical protein OIU74_014767 [Salix koriyanagi]|uniref:Uncharacterized protein n=1 Tax=Salix koriyanagi TaxID=2511006 RepID=A0A9Q0PWJ1_9ROSI|nr:hypothetical protein OIU74_014767 [Salix koriyanagi]
MATILELYSNQTLNPDLFISAGCFLAHLLLKLTGWLQDSVAISSTICRRKTVRRRNMISRGEVARRSRICEVAGDRNTISWNVNRHDSMEVKKWIIDVPMKVCMQDSKAHLGLTSCQNWKILRQDLHKSRPNWETCCNMKQHGG